MRLYDEKTGGYIKALAHSISIDPHSMDQWKCLFIHPKEEQKVEHEAIKALCSSLKEVDCDLLICSDNDVLLISRELTHQELNTIALDLTKSFEGEAPDIAIYDLFQDWQLIRNLLLEKAGDEALVKSSDDAQDHKEFVLDFLTDVFEAAKKERPNRKIHHILLVEDDKLTKRLLANVYKGDFALITAETASDAIEKYMLYAPDIVFLDIGLPDVSGFEVLNQLMKIDEHAYVVMFSGNSYLDNVMTALNAGASGFIGKPFKKDKMDKYIEDSAFHHNKVSM
jgi:two-component system chemotaxis response regulator CheY